MVLQLHFYYIYSWCSIPQNTEIKFGAEKPSNKDIGDNCVICDVKFTSNVKTFSDAVKQFTKRKCEWKKCWACNEVNENVTLQYVAHVFIFLCCT